MLRDCLNRHIEERVGNVDSGAVSVSCPFSLKTEDQCGSLIADSDLRLVLGKKRHEEIMDAALARLVANETNSLVQCPNEDCGAVVEQIEPNPECKSLLSARIRVDVEGDT